MSLPRVLLVDDSEVVLAFGRAALSGHYNVATASNGREALRKIAEEKPDAVLLDLSMPELPGDAVLAALQLDPALRRIPVIIVSSEVQRAEACLRAGARAFLGKPLRAPELLAQTTRVLDEAARAELQRGLAVLFVKAGPHELGLPLASVGSVLHQPATQPLPLGPSYLSELLVLHGEPICVLDLPRRLFVAHARPLVERMLVVVQLRGARLALCVDEVRDPEELPRESLTPREQLAAFAEGPLQDALLAVARTARGLLPVIDPAALVSPRLLASLARSLAQGGAA